MSHLTLLSPFSSLDLGSQSIWTIICVKASLSIAFQLSQGVPWSIVWRTRRCPLPIPELFSGVDAWTPDPNSCTSGWLSHCTSLTVTGAVVQELRLELNRIMLLNQMTLCWKNNSLFVGIVQINVLLGMKLNRPWIDLHTLEIPGLVGLAVPSLGPEGTSSDRAYLLVFHYCFLITRLYKGWLLDTRHLLLRVFWGRRENDL